MLTGFLNESGTIRVVIANTTKISNKLLDIHHFSYPVSRIMSKFITGAVLVSSTLKGNDVMGCYLDANGPISGMRIEVNSLGHVKGYCINPSAGLDESNKTYALTDDQLINNGKLTVTKVLESGKHPFSGTVEFEGSDIAIIFSNYLLRSEQTNSALLISNVVQPDGIIEKSVGMLVQTMPGATDEEVANIEKTIIDTAPFSQIINSAHNDVDIITAFFKKNSFNKLFNRKLDIKCSCNRFKVITVLKSLNSDDLKQVVDKDGKYSVDCEYCQTNYKIANDELNETVN